MQMVGQFPTILFWNKVETFFSSFSEEFVDLCHTPWAKNPLPKHSGDGLPTGSRLIGMKWSLGEAFRFDVADLQKVRKNMPQLRLFGQKICWDHTELWCFEMWQMAPIWASTVLGR